MERNVGMGPAHAVIMQCTTNEADRDGRASKPKRRELSEESTSRWEQTST